MSFHRMKTIVDLILHQPDEVILKTLDWTMCDSFFLEILDLDCLADHAWLNDVVIRFHMRLIQKYKTSADSAVNLS